jgi:hypothetical protein
MSKSSCATKRYLDFPSSPWSQTGPPPSLLAAPSCAAFGDVFTYDGAAWSQIAKGKTSAETKQKLQGFFDPSRKTVVLWNFTYDYEKACEIVKAHTVSEDGKLAVLATRGELPP